MDKEELKASAKYGCIWCVNFNAKKGKWELEGQPYEFFENRADATDIFWKPTKNAAKRERDLRNKAIKDKESFHITDRTSSTFVEDSDDVSLWFSLSRASWAVLPRVAMEAMPKKWQKEMGKLLFELDEEFPNFPLYRYSILLRDEESGRYFSPPEAITNYRHPRKEIIDSWRKQNENKSR